jgi:ATP-dependent protease ClpP protease subunit
LEEIFLYSGIYDWTIQPVLEQLKEIGSKKPVKIRTNSGGGDVFSAQGLLADMQKREGETILAIDGNGSSMAFFLAVYASRVQILSTTKALVHRADIYEATDEDKKLLGDINGTFKSAMLSKIDPISFVKVTGKTIDQIFDPNNREEIWLNAKNLVDIGLVKKEDVFELTPSLAAEISDKMKNSLGAYHEPESNNNHLKIEKMADEKNEINVAEITANAIREGVEKETARVSAWMVWAEIDLKKVQSGISSGKEISAKETQEFILAMSNKTNLGAIQTNSPGAVTTPKTEPTAEEKEKHELIEAEKQLNAALGLKVEVK